MMQCSEQGLALIQRFEGFSAVPYRCPAGYWTIGYGHRLVNAVHESIHQEQGLLFLRQDVRIAESAIRHLIRATLTQAQFDALVSFTFNLGSGALQRSSLRRVINREDHEAVPAQLMRWVWGGGRKLPGLVRRREAEVKLYCGY